MTDGAKLRPVVYKMILQKYTSQWIDPTYVLVVRVYLGDGLNIHRFSYRK